MSHNRPQNVIAAFDILLEEIEAEINFTNSIGACAFADSDYNRARHALEHASYISTFRDKLVSLRRDWDQIISKSPEEKYAKIEENRRNLGRLKHGRRTQEHEYYCPILKTLVRQGGSGKASEVLDQVQELMSGVLEDVDFETLISEPNTPRWRNAAHWARNSMVREGMLKSDSPRGIWEISEKGLQYLNMND
ncbi:winged helix-turn-helix domain-containing protein [candidate division CSSED10-310 bacterium]|uniref:Winged helix-turn-helix domain-containing protein n=1 Tax=candidate division CSSED10-310 bacterium TaxID=2855610 RepID=A0ABV6YXP1_UNCC1